MKAAVVHAAGQLPAFDDFEPPILLPGEQLVHVKAAALTHLVRVRAAGSHYTAGGGYPKIAGVDGVGVLEGGQRVYFANVRAPYGAMAELVPVLPENCVPVPDGMDDITAAALPNPGISGWMALRERANFQAGENVLINGATGVSGSLSIQIARHFGAHRIIATGRNAQRLQDLASLGADQTISLLAEEGEQRAAIEKAFVEGIDIVLDFLWGPSGKMILAASSKISDPARPLRFVQIGSLTGEEVLISAHMLRSRANMLMGSGLGSVAPDRIRATVKDVLSSAREANLRIETETLPLSDVTDAWRRDMGNRRLVFSL